jgi:hypothetical protein
MVRIEYKANTPESLWGMGKENETDAALLPLAETTFFYSFFSFGSL